MDLSKLLASRNRLIEQARLANTAYAYATLRRCAAVARRAGLSGPVQLQQPDIEMQRYWTSISPVCGNASVYEEHFSDDDVVALADAIAFATGVPAVDFTFQIDELEQEFLAPLAEELEKAGISLDAVEPSSTTSNSAAPDNLTA